MIITEAKMFSKLSPGIKNASYYNQAARNVACIAEVVRRANINPDSFVDMAFYVIAPEIRIADGVFKNHMTKEGISEIVHRRISEYDDRDKKQWLEEWFLPTLDCLKLRCISWEELIALITKYGDSEGVELLNFYNYCLEFNSVMADKY